MTEMAGFSGSEYAEYSSASTETRSPASKIRAGTSARSPRVGRQLPPPLSDDRHHLAARSTEDRTETPLPERRFLARRPRYVTSRANANRSRSWSQRVVVRK